MTTAIKTAATTRQVREPTRELDEAKRRDELLDSELDTVTGGTFFIEAAWGPKGGFC
jgi:hypothetical protein